MRDIHELLASSVFDTEVTAILGKSFDRAWQATMALEPRALDPTQADTFREQIAREIIETCRRGERNSDRLVAAALNRLADLNAPRLAARA